MMFTWSTLKNVIHTAGEAFGKLAEVYGQLPETRCLRQGHCCALLPEMTLIEGLSAFRSLTGLAPDMRNRTFKRLVG